MLMCVGPRESPKLAPVGLLLLLLHAFMNALCSSVNHERCGRAGPGRIRPCTGRGGCRGEVIRLIDRGVRSDERCVLIDRDESDVRGVFMSERVKEPWCEP